MLENLWQTVKIDTSTFNRIEWGALWPAWIASGSVLVVLLADLILPKNQRRLLSWFACAGLILAGGSAFVLMDSNPSAFQNMIAADDLSRFMAAIIFGTAALVVLASPDYLSRIGVEATGEYYALVTAAATGMWLLAAAIHFMVFFLALELFSLALYILAGFLPRSTRSHEAGFKYFLLSSFASAFLLYGIALIFGATGTTSYYGGNGKDGILQYLVKNGLTGNNGILFLFGLGLLLVGFAFKVSAIPFHMWTPDVYEGAPTPVTLLMAVGTKAAIIAAFLRVFTGVLAPIANDWRPLIWVLAAVTMVGGNLLAVSQTNIKRLLAYSAVAQAGYLLVGLVSDNTLGRQGLVFYILAYSVMTVGAFAVVITLEGPRREGLAIGDFAGLAHTHPWLAAILALCLMSLGGVPPTVGFFGKAFVFGAAIQAGGWYLALAIIGVLTSVVAIFYYFRIVVQMYMGTAIVQPEGIKGPLVGKPTASLSFVLLVAAIGTLGLGFFAGIGMDWAQHAVTTIMGLDQTRQ